MKQILITLALTALAFTTTNAQTVCQPAAHKHTTAVKHKNAAKTTNTTTACRMLPFQVCSINPDRRSVSCYYTTDTNMQNRTGATTVYNATGPMPGEAVHFKVRTIIIKDKDKGSYCKRNDANNATVCTQPGYIVRDENGYYSYGEAIPKSGTSRITAK